VYTATTEGWEDIDRFTTARDKAWVRVEQSQQRHDQHKDRIARDLAHQRNREKMHKGAWAFTLTYSPLKHGWSKDEAKDAMRKALERLQHYYRHELEEFHAVGEHTQAGLPHVHGYYRLEGGKRITTKNFKRAYPPWNPHHVMGKGHEGGYHEPAKSDSDYSGYIQKDLDDAWIVVTHPNGTTAQEDHQSEEDVPEASDDDTATDSTHDQERA